MTPRVAVLMSSYNGELYIKEQIDSILHQKNVEVSLFIRDDGSTDNTLEIIKSYLNDKRVKLFVDGRNLRPGLSFLTLLSKVISEEPVYEYYSFADQDDVWLEEKLDAAVKSINDADKPILYCSNQIIFHDGKQEGCKFLKQPKISLMRSVSVNDFYGCTMVFNRKMGELVDSTKKPSDYFLLKRNHDAWFMLLALIKGEVIYDNNAYIKYRIHNHNTVGLNKMTFVQRLNRFLKNGVRNLRKTTCEDLLNAFPELFFDDRQHIENMANYQKSLKARLLLLKDYKMCKCTNERALVFWYKVLINYI